VEEYEALVLGLRAAKDMGIEELAVFVLGPHIVPFLPILFAIVIPFITYI
jgi:hypothetical protein